MNYIISQAEDKGNEGGLRACLIFLFLTTGVRENFSSKKNHP